MQFLVATDGSTESDRALADAAEVAEAMDAGLTVVHVVDPSVFDAGGTEPISTLGDAGERLVMESVEDAEERGIDVLEQAAERVEARALDVDTELLYGDPARQIVEYAADHDVDAIFVGHRGLSDRVEGMLGSVASTVTERATVPVTVIR